MWDVGRLNTMANDGKKYRDQASGDFMSRLFNETSARGGFSSEPRATGAVYTRRGFHRTAQQSDPFGGFGSSASATNAGFTSGTVAGGRSTAQISTPIYYDPRYSTPDKFYYPRSEVQANAIWRHMYRSDPAVGAALDVWSELPFSEFDLLGLEDDPRVKEIYESMMSDLNLLSWLPELAREYLITGKVVPHLIYDTRKNYWSNLLVYNPDYLAVTPVPVPGFEPVIDLKPTPELRALATSQDPRLVRARAKLPPKIIHYAIAGIPIPLDPLNATYIARKISPYTHLGTSMLSRLYQIQMVSDFLINAYLAVAQRNAAPLRIFKLGDPATGFLPSKSDEESFLNMLAIAETDPFAAIVYNYGLSVELVGVSDRLLCHPAGTLITLEDGTQCPIEFVEPDTILQGGSGTPVKALNVKPLKYKGTMVTLCVQGLPEPVCVTAEHRLLVIKRPPCYKNGEPCKKAKPRKHNGYCGKFFSKFRYSSCAVPTEAPASEIRAGDLLVAPRHIKGKKTRPVSPDVARLIGYYLADGCAVSVNRNRDAGISIALDKSDTTIIKDIMDIMRKEFGVKPAVYKAYGNGVHVRGCYPKEPARKMTELLIKYADKYSQEKWLHRSIFCWEEDLQLELLKGYFLGDGWTRKYVMKWESLSLMASTTSPWLASQLVRLLQITGFAPSLGIREEAYHRRNNHVNAPKRHTITLTQASARKLYGLLNGKKYTGTFKRSAGNQVVGDWVQYSVKDVSSRPYKGNVYNLETDGNHLYLANFISSHNSASREWDFIERVKFLGLGISKSFLLGEASYASAVAGLQTMVERLQTFRRMFERRWINPKIFVAIAKMNEFYRRTPAELSHRVRIQKKESQLIVPRIWWRKRLEPTQDNALLSTWRDLMERGIISERTMATGAGLDLDAERRQIVEEKEYKKEIMDKHPDLFAEGEEGPKGLPGAPPMPTASRKTSKKSSGNGHDPYRFPVASDHISSRIWDKEGKFCGVHYEDVEPLVELLREGDTSHPEWKKFGKKAQLKSAPEGGEILSMQWDDIDAELVSLGRTDEEIATIRKVLTLEGVLTDADATEEAAALADAEAQLEKSLHGTEEGSIGSKDLLGGREE